MRLSVFNKATGKYKIYESDLHPIPTGDLQTNLGAIPSLSLLPAINVRYLGQADFAQGQIVTDPASDGLSLGKFVSLGLAVTFTIFFFKWLKNFEG